VRAIRLGLVGVALLAAALPTRGIAEPGTPSPLNTFADIRKAFLSCWRWPPLNEARSGMMLTVRVAFTRDGEVMSTRITYQSKDVSDEQRTPYYRALLAALGRCTPLLLSESLAEAIAGRPVIIHIHDTRSQRKV
jgi:hypothetical protein